MNENLKPDLGTYFSEKYNRKISHHFYSVPCHEIIFAGKNLYTLMENAIFADKEFAVSFDFTKQLLISILDQIKDDDFKKYLY